jgi:hypothetical protein
MREKRLRHELRALRQEAKAESVVLHAALRVVLRAALRVIRIGANKAKVHSVAGKVATLAVAHVASRAAVHVAAMLVGHAARVAKAVGHAVHHVVISDRAAAETAAHQVGHKAAVQCGATGMLTVMTAVQWGARVDAATVVREVEAQSFGQVKVERERAAAAALLLQPILCVSSTSWGGARKETSAVTVTQRTRIARIFSSECRRLRAVMGLNVRGRSVSSSTHQSERLVAL